MDKYQWPKIKYCGVLGYMHRIGKCSAFDRDHIGEQMTKPVIQIRKGAKVYIVEDNEERLSWFASKMPHATIWHIKDPDQAVEQLRTMPPESFDCIFLDFDLGPGDAKNSTVNSIPVVDFLNSRLSKRQQRNIVIHSQNSPGSFWMAAMLPGAARLMFGDFDIVEV